jgi:hypothetical protein
MPCLYPIVAAATQDVVELVKRHRPMAVATPVARIVEVVVE